MPNQAQQNQGCTEQYHKITTADLPLSCPLNNQRIWDAHPRVYLPIEKTGKANCPYCGTQYVLISDTPKS